jgi:dTDP-glucose 4,6-dehydratase
MPSPTLPSTSKVLITGGLGFIFSHVSEYFLKKGLTVVVLDDCSEGSHPELVKEWEEKYPDTFKFKLIDVAELPTQDYIISEEPDYIIHAAAISDVDFSIRDPEYTLRQNILATINVFEAARHLPNLKKLLYVSTDEVYGECEEKKDETDIIFPKNPYAASKAVGSLLRLAYGNTYLTLDEKTCETRFCNVIGDRQDPRKVLPRIVQSMKDGSKMPVQNGGKGYREYIFVENIPPAIELILEKGWRTYNITNNDGFTVEDLIKKVEEVSGKTIETTEAHRPGMDKIYQMDSSRIRNELGWTPLYSFEEGLSRYLIKEGIC